MTKNEIETMKYVVKLSDLKDYLTNNLIPQGHYLQQDVEVLQSLDLTVQTLETFFKQPHTPKTNDTTIEINGVKLEMIYIPGGEFLMGLSKFDKENPFHRVKLSPYLIGKYPVTQVQWAAVMGNNPSHFRGDELPVENVSWNDAVKFCKTISTKTGKAFRLPSEAEWEYGARADSTGHYCFGNDENMLGEYAWYYENSDMKTHPVERKQPNAFGLYDMHGNVWEWCEDVWHENYKGAPLDGSAWLSGGDSSFRVLRGGSWGSQSYNCRSAYRGLNRPDARSTYNGFRVVVGVRIS